MTEIKSTLEIAMEKANRLGAADKNEAALEDLFNKGRRLAARYMNGEEKDLQAGLKNIKKDELAHVINGTIEVLLRNIALPKEKDQWQSINRAFSGIMALKGSPVKEIIAQIKELFKTYELTRTRYYDQLKMQMQGKLGGLQQSIAKQYGTTVAASIIEALPEFQNEWLKLSSELNEQFDHQLQQLKTQLK
ncbi:MAG: hypothetical protein ACUVQ6_08870 [Dissulfurimicrobium sp.]|uniref:hypothetical protein n=1 Tax=Dissulfurimicrobium sp. TaxID=2022436 RepID=UPI004049ED12